MIEDAIKTKCNIHKVFDETVEGITKGECYEQFVEKVFDIMSMVFNLFMPWVFNRKHYRQLVVFSMRGEQ